METLTKTAASTAYSTAQATMRTDHRLPREYVTIDSTRVLQDKLSFYIITVLSLLWLSAQLLRYIEQNLNAGCWFGWDAMALVAVAFSCGQRQYAIACIFTTAFFVWTRPPGSPFNDLNLPSFNTFLATTSKLSGEAADTASLGTAENAPACLVCWSSDPRPMKLPCNHHMCFDCLATMNSCRQTRCPLCRRSLFHNNDGWRCAIHKASIATLAARLVANGISLFLQLWHGQYWQVAQSAATYFPQFYCFRVLYGVVLTPGLEWWQFGMFDYLMPLPVPEGRFWRSVWPPAIFTLLFPINILGHLGSIAKLDLIVERVVH